MSTISASTNLTTQSKPARLHPQVTLIRDGQVITSQSSQSKLTSNNSYDSPVAVTVEQNEGKLKICLSKSYSKPTEESHESTWVDSDKK